MCAIMSHHLKISFNKQYINKNRSEIYDINRESSYNCDDDDDK